MKSAYDVIIKPVISERSMDITPEKKYTFKVATDANKTEIKQAVEEIFNVKVESVNIVHVKPREKRMGRYVGMTKAVKKAYVKLKDGYSINVLADK